jgi:DNA-directed RNA polymerase alpha subunit
MSSVSVFCIESRVEDNDNFYARFQLGPFDLDQGLTFANTLRRALLSELKGLAITSVVITGASHEYSTLPGVKETVLDILLNLKKVVFSTKSFVPTEGSGGRNFFNQEIYSCLKIEGPTKVYAKHLKLPPQIECVNPLQHIATLSYDGVLELRVTIAEGKNYIIHTPSGIKNPSSNTPSSKPKINLNKILSQNEILEKSKTELALLKKVEYHRENREKVDILLRRVKEEIKKNFFNIPATNVSNSSSPAPQGYLQNKTSLLGFSELKIQEKKAEPTHRYFDSQVDKILKEPQIKLLFDQLKSNNQKLNQKNLVKELVIDELFKTKKAQNLLIDSVFMPVEKVNFFIETPFEFTESQENVILDIWTNGSIHPRRAIQEAAKSLVGLFEPFQFFDKTTTSSPSKASVVRLLKKKSTNDFLSVFRESKETFDRAYAIGGTSPHSNFDIENFNFSEKVYIALKKENINTIDDLLMCIKKNKFLINKIRKLELSEITKKLKKK